MRTSDLVVSEAAEREMPGFWVFLKARHPRFGPYGQPDGAPIGYVHAHEVHEAMAETIPAYIAEMHKQWTAKVLENVPEEGREAVAYALDLASQ